MLRLVRYVESRGWVVDLTGTAGDLVARWGWLVALVVLFALVYKFGIGASSGSSSAGAGCLAAVAITALFFVFVIF